MLVDFTPAPLRIAPGRRELSTMDDATTVQRQWEGGGAPSQRPATASAARTP
jgi:hypothetical protein